MNASKGILLVVFFVWSCGLSRRERPEGVLSHAQMAAVLTEFYLQEAVVQGFNVGSDSAVVLMEEFASRYSVKSGIPDSLFSISLEYYLQHPKEFGVIHDAVIDTLALREQRARVKPDAEK